MQKNIFIIPKGLRSATLKQRQTGHQEIHRCQERAGQSVWWSPGILKEIEELVNNCIECCKMHIQRSEMLMPSTLPELP